MCTEPLKNHHFLEWKWNMFAEHNFDSLFKAYGTLQIFITSDCFTNVQQCFTPPRAAKSSNQKVLSVSLHTLLHSSNEHGQTRRLTSAGQTKLKQMLHIRHAPVHVWFIWLCKLFFFLGVCRMPPSALCYCVLLHAPRLMCHWDCFQLENYNKPNNNTWNHMKWN